MTISHLYQDPTTGKWEIQANEAHSEGVAQLAEEFSKEFSMEEFGRVLGELHDKGKETRAFQAYIKRESGFDPSARAEGDRNHAYVGAKIAQRVYSQAYKDLLTNQIFSHHSGLHDNGFEESLKKPMPEEVNADMEKKALAFPKLRYGKQDLHHVSRLLFSCLVDADFLDTERFMNPASSRLRQGKKSLAELEPALDAFLASMKQKATPSPVNKIRNDVQAQCVKEASGPRGFYSLTVPTGGGKTLSSLLWAMKHALRNGQRRIIIAIPYTSIIVQTAAVLKQIFGEENVLEHHSNVDTGQITDEELRRKMEMAAENWDYPIIVTTNVQLFESMFANRPASCRKLHNIVRSVIILDEVQTLPTDFLLPIVDSLRTYQKLFGASVLFTTASQPVLSGPINGCNPKAHFDGLESIKEIIPSSFGLHDKLRRVQLDINDAPQTYDDVAAALVEHDRVLCIVNTKRDAKEIFQRLPQEGVTLHLSRAMCSAHIRETIVAIKWALADDAEPIVRVVATQLVEAGVDIDFPVVYRQEAGLDSVLQAAGRCNREGRRDVCTTHVFSLAKERPLPSGAISDGNQARQALGSDCDWFAPETMAHYFEQLYCRKQTFDKKDMRYLLYKPLEMQFATAAKEFRLIDKVGYQLLVVWDDSAQLIAQLKQTGPTYALMKKLGQYMVNVYEQDFKALSAMGVVTEICDGLYAVEYQQQYDRLLGLLTDNNWTNEFLNV